MKFDYDWNPKLNEHQIEFRVLDIDDDGEILRRTDILIGWLQYHWESRRLYLVGVSLPDDTYDFDTDGIVNRYTSIRTPRYYRPIISGDIILYDGLSLLFNTGDNDIGYGVINLSNAFAHKPVKTMVEILQIVKTIDFTREYTHDEVLHEIERYMML